MTYYLGNLYNYKSPNTLARVMLLDITTETYMYSNPATIYHFKILQIIRNIIPNYKQFEIIKLTLSEANFLIRKSDQYVYTITDLYT